MKIDLLSNAKVIDRAVKFIDIHRDLGEGLLIDQNLPFNADPGGVIHLSIANNY
jgi:hypothetical protein